MCRALALLLCLLTAPAWADGFAAPPTVLPGYLFGLTLVVSGVASVDTIPGTATSDDNTTSIALTTTITKTLGAFASGSGNGGLDTGSAAVSTWYHEFLIYNPTTGATDILYSLSPTAPTLPSGFTKKRRIGSIRSDPTTAVNVVNFLQVGDTFIWKTTPTNLNNITPVATTATAFTITVPSGLRVMAMIRAQYQGSTSVGVRIQSPDEDFPNGNLLATNGTGNQAGQATILTNTSSQLQYYSSAASGTLLVLTYGWLDTRGK